jgi:hypothetical protein
MPFAPELCRESLQYMYDAYGDKIWSRYGFADAFNPHTKWVSPDVLGIDLGITLLMIENARDDFVWKYFMKNPDMQEAMIKVGFIDTTPKIDNDDKVYLTEIARDTWHSIDSMINKDTGLPYDNSGMRPQTSVSNIGLYLTDIIGAYEMGFITRKDAEQRVALALKSFKELKTWHGFQQSWNDVETLQPATNDVWVSIIDSGNLAAGLIAAGEAFPGFKELCEKLVMDMDWTAFYNRKTKLLCGGYNTVTGKFNMKWSLPFLGSDSRMASFMAVATGKVPVDSWNALDRSREERHHAYFLKPGWINGGGVFEQYLPGLWLDERDTFMGQSAANFTYVQIRQAQLGSYPAWGWSASDSPDDGYLGMGALKDNIVTPHASVLAVSYFPNEVIKNLHALDKLGARSKKYGYVDAIDIKSSKCTDNFLVLDQSMLFLSLVNFLHDDVIQKHFESSSIVKNGRQRIKDYREPCYGENISILDLR